MIINKNKQGTPMLEIGKEDISYDFIKGLGDQMPIAEYTEIVIDKAFDEGALKEIPIVGTLIAVYKVGKSVRDRFFIRKIMMFLDDVKNGISDIKKFEEFKQKYINDEEKRENLVEHILIMIDGYKTREKAKILARLLIALANGKLDYDRFVHLSLLLDYLPPKGYNGLHHAFLSGFKPMHGLVPVPEIEILKAAGLTWGLKFSGNGDYEVSPDGKLLYEHGIKYLDNLR